MERLNRVNQQFSEETSVSRNVCVNDSNNIVQEICNDSCSKMSYSDDLSSDYLNKSLEPQEYVPAYRCDKRSGYVFVDVGSNPIESVNLLEEADDICKVSSETVFTDGKDIDYNLIKNVSVERLLKNSSEENEICNPNLETTLFNDIYTGNDRSGLSKNPCRANMCENLDDYDKKPIIDINYTTTSTNVGASRGLEKVNTYVKEEKSVDVLEIKKEEMFYNEEVSVLNESIIDIKLHPMIKVENPSDSKTNYSCILDENMPCRANVCENLVDYDMKPIIDINYTTTSTDVSASRGLEKVNTCVKEETSVDLLEIKKEEMVYNEEVSVLNESIIDFKLHPLIKVEDPSDSNTNYSCILDENSKFVVLNKPVKSDFQEVHTECSEEMVYNEEISVLNESIIDNKIHSVNKVEESLDTDTNYSCILDKNSKTGFIVLRKNSKSDFQEVHTQCSEEVPDNSDIGKVMVLKPLEKNETVQSKRKCRLKLQNKIQTVNRTCSELQIKPLTNSGGKDDTGAAGVEECNNKVNEDDLNTQAKNKNDAVCQHHRKRKSKNKTERHYVCKVCNIDFIQLCDLKAHKCSHTGDRPFGCDTCGKTFRRLDHLKNHKRTHTGDTFDCNTCSKTFTAKDQLKKHKRIHAGDEPFTCDTCFKTFTRKDRLIDHIRIHSGDRPFGCDTCGTTFKQKDHLKGHVRIHTGDKPFGCDTCGKVFTQLAGLKNHKRIHAGDRPFGCDTCGKTFTRKVHLIDHTRIHTGDKPFGCDTCGKAFTSDTSLRRHKRIHTGDRPFGCDTCGKTFTQMGDLKGHIRIHTGDKPFVCDTCGKAFTSLTSLRYHKPLHTGDRPFSCDTCGKAFTRMGHLKDHIRIHTGDKPFVCDTCGKAFSCRNKLKRHKPIHTGDRLLGSDTSG